MDKVPRMLGLPDGVTACLFDLDGVLTQTAKVHDRAWKQTFDEYLAEHLLPRLGVDGGGLRQDAVEVEQAGGDAIWQAEHLPGSTTSA